MPFAILMTETLRRREIRDKEKGYSDKYLQARDNREVWYVVNYVLALMVIFSVNAMSVGIPVLMRIIITVIALGIFTISVYRFFKSISHF